MASFSSGLRKIFSLPPFCFVEYSVNAPAQIQVSTRAEILLRLHEVFNLPARAEHPSPVSKIGLGFSAGQKRSQCNRHFHFKRISFRTRAEIRHVITPLEL